jgi:ABC-type sugar transport system permease subunit
MQRRLGYIMVMPAVALLALFAYWPLVEALRLAFYQADGLSPDRFVGLGNFVQMTDDPVLKRSVGTLALLMLMAIPLQVIGPLLGAKLLAGMRSERFAYLYRVLLVLPMVIPAIVGVLVWRSLYSGDGAINELLRAIGLGEHARAWLGDANFALPAIVFTGVPFVGGINLLIYLAGFLAIPRDVYEALSLDGATPRHVFFQVEVPLLSPQISLVTLLAIFGAIQSYEQILILTNGGPGNATLVPALHLFQSAFQFGNLGYASAIGVVLFVVCAAASWLSLRLSRSRREELA